MPINEYEETLQNLNPTQKNPYQETIEQRSKSSEVLLRNSVMRSAEKDPEREAAVLGLSRRTGLPANVVERNFDQIKSRSEIADTPYAQMLRETPKAAEWLSDPNNAAVAKDDFANMGLLDWIVAAPVRALQRGYAQVEFGELRYKSMFSELTAAEQKRLDTLRANMSDGGELGAKTWFGKAIVGGYSQLPVLLGGLKEGAVRGLGYGAAYGTAAAVAGQLGPQMALPEEVVTVPAATALGFTHGTMVGGSMFTFRHESAGAYEEFRNMKDTIGRPMDADVARMAAMAVGVINAGIEVGQINVLLKSIPGLNKLAGSATHVAIKRALAVPSVQAALKALALEYGKGLASETAQEVAQRAVTILGGELAKATGTQSIPYRPGADIAADLVREGLDSATAFALTLAPGHLAELRADAVKIQQSKNNEQFFQALGKGVTDSKTFQRLPEKVRDFIAAATKDGPVETVYIPAETFNQYWQSKSLDPSEALSEVIPDGKRIFQEALDSGSDIAIPMADYATKLAPTEHNTFFAREVRLAPDQMNAREAEEFEAKMTAAMQAEQEEATPMDSASRVREDIVGQLLGQGYDRSAVDAYAGMYESAFRTMGERSGIDAYELYQRYGLSVTRPIPEVLRSVGKLSGVDVLLDKLRSGQVPTDKEQYGTSLLEFVREAGGVQDFAGDLASREPDKDRKPFQRNLIQQETGLPLDMAREKAAEAGYLPIESNISDFLDKLEEEFRGTPVYSKDNYNDQAIESAVTLAQMKSYLDARGIELNAMSNEEIKLLLEEVSMMERSTNDVEFSQKRDAGSGPRLSVLHKLQDDGLIFADSIGGLAVPSLAVVPETMAMGEGYGNITLIGREDLGDPAREPVFDADIYSATFPRPEYPKVKSKVAQDVVDEYKPFTKFSPHWRGFIDEIWDNAVNNPKPDETISRLLNDNAAKAWFLSTLGKSTDPVMADKRISVEWVTDPEFMAAFEAWRNVTRDMPGGSEEHLAENAKLSDVARAAIRRYAASDETFKKRVEIFGSEEQALEHYGVVWGQSGEWVTDPSIQPHAFYFDNEVGRKSIDNLGKQEVDEAATTEALNELLKGHEAEFKSWIEEKIMGMYGLPFLKIGKSKYPYTLSNIVDYMTSPKSIKAVEKTMTFGEGKARAASARRFGSIEEMRKYADKIGEPDKIEEARAEAKAAMEAWRNKVVNYYGDAGRNEFGRVWDGLDASMRAIARWARGGKTEENLYRALRREGFNISDYSSLLEEGVEAGKLFLKAPVPYFEAKPQRAVAISEFAGAVIPSNALPAVRQILDQHGVAYREYDPNVQGAQAKATVEFRNELAAKGENVLFQPAQIIEYEQDQRGSIRFGEDRQFDIELLEQADLSTFIHESGHFYLEVMGDIVEQLRAKPDGLTDQQQRMVDDYGKILKWLNVESRDKIGVDQHEQWARGIEAYMLEGKAPSAGLRAIFSRFRSWLLTLYRSLSQLNVTLTDEVRGAMDRMFATDVEIDLAGREAAIEPLFSDAKMAGMTDAEFAVYQKTVSEASEAARSELQGKLMDQFLRRREEWWKQRRSEMREEVAGEVYQRREYMALSFLRYGKLPDGSPLPEGVEAVKLDLNEVDEAYGKGTKKKVDGVRQGSTVTNKLKDLGVTRREGGVSPRVVADLFGYSSADEFIQAVVNARPMKELIEAETDDRMRQQFGDMLLDGSVHDAARSAVFNEGRSKVIEAEMIALARKRREVKPFVDQARKAERQQQRETQRAGIDTFERFIPKIDAVRFIAERRVREMKVRDIKPMSYFAAARRASKQATDAALRQDFDTALAAKQRELMNTEMYRAASVARDEVDKTVEYMNTFTEKKKRERVGKAGGDYLDQIDGLLDRFDFVRVPLKILERRKALVAWIAEKERQGLQIDVPEDIVAEARRINFKDLSYEQLNGLRDTVKQIEHLSKVKNKLLKAKLKRELNEATDDIVASINGNSKGPRALQIETRLPGGNVVRMIDGWFAAHRKLASILREMDGLKDGGMLWEYIMRPVNDAANEEATMNAQATERLNELFTGTYGGRELAAMSRDKMFMPAIGTSITKMGRIMVALNWGNEGNRQRIMGGRGWSEDQVNAILDTLDERDWKFIQGVWNYIDSYWPAIEAKQKRVTGVAPEKVDRITVQTRFGDFDGGYFPIKYDDQLSARAGANLEAEFADISKQASYVRAATRHGHTEARLEKVNQPVRLDFGVIFEHVQQVIHDLTHHEMLIDAGRILGSKSVQEAIYAHYGDVYYKQMKSTLLDIAYGDTDGARWMKPVDWLRQGATISALAWNVMTSLLQPVGIFPSIVRVGPKWVAKGAYRWFRDIASFENTARWIQGRSEFMQNRGRTQMREINEIRNTVGLNTGRLSGWIDDALRSVSADRVTKLAIVDSFFILIQRAQQVADIPTWLGAYEKAMSQPGMEESRAIALADQAVIDSQGSGQIKDLAQVQRGGSLLKLWTNFYSYFSVIYNLTAESAKRTEFKNPLSVGRFAVDMLMLYTLPAIISVGIREALTGSDDDDESFLTKVIADQLTSLFGTMLFTREIASGIAGYAGYTGPAGTRFISSVVNLIKQGEQGEVDAAFLRSLNEVGGMIFHYPANQVRRTAEGILALSEGETQNPLAVIFGPPKN